MIDPLRVHKYSQKILEIVDNQDEFTRSDLQGAVDAIVINMIAEIEAEK